MGSGRTSIIGRPGPLLKGWDVTMRVRRSRGRGVPRVSSSNPCPSQTGRRSSSGVAWWRLACAGHCTAALLLAGCGDVSPDVGPDYVAAEVVQVYGRSDSMRLELSVGSCNKQPRANVVETSTEVRVAATAERPGKGGEGDCLDSVIVELQESLGSRPVVDDSSGEVLPMLPIED